MLKVNDVYKSFEFNGVRTHALRGFNLDVAKGEFIAITGSSGSGKSTFLSLAGLLDCETSGSIYFDGNHTQSMTDSERTKLRSDKIGFIFQDFNLINSLTILENLELPLWYRGLNGKKANEKALEGLTQVGLVSRKNHFPGQLSGGQQQRVAIARALICEPDLILADEPTGNLDREMALEVMNMLRNINDTGKTILMVTHDLELAKMAGKIIYVSDGVVQN